jgi:hypothetical protein
MKKLLLALLVFIAFTPHAHAALTTNIKGYWKLDESSGNASDATGNGFTLTNAGTVTYAPAKINNGAVFSGSNNLTNTGISLTSAMTISGWMKAANTSVFIPIAFRNDTNADFYMMVFGNGVSEFRFRNSGGTAFTLNPTLSTPTAFHFYTLTYDGSTLTAYVDGSSVGSTPASGSFSSTPTFGVGTSDTQGNGAGTIDEVGVWTRALTSTEVSQLYNGGAGIQYPFAPAAKFTPWQFTDF